MKSIFVRLMLTFICILLPVFYVGYSIYDWGLKTVKKEIASSMEAQLDFTSHNLEQELLRIRILEYDMLSDVSLDALAVESNTLSEYDRDMNLIRVQQRIDAIKSSSRYITKVTIVIPTLGKSVSTPSILDLEKTDEALIRASYAMSNTKLNSFEGALVFKSDSSVIGKTNGNSPLFYIFIYFSNPDIIGMLQEIQTYQGSGSFIFARNDALIIDSGTNPGLAEEIRSYTENELSLYPTKAKQSFFQTFGNNEYFVTFSTVGQLGLSMVRYVPTQLVFQKIQYYRTLFWIYSFTTLIIILVFSFSTYRFIHRPLSKLVKAFYRVEKGDITVSIKHKLKDEFKHIYDRFNSMLSNLNALIDQVYRQKILLQNAELKQLQSQINPHFLYNNFFILHRWIQHGYTDEALQLSEQLGNYFKFVTRSSADEVPLAKEVQHAKAYTDIQSVRFSSRIQTEFADLPAGWAHRMVPRLLLQPVIENAFEHGLEQMEKCGKLRVSYEAEDGCLRIIVEDNGQNLTDSELEKMKASLIHDDMHMEITGMLNIHRRIRLKFGNASGVALNRGEMGGLKVTLCLDMGGGKPDV